MSSSEPEKTILIIDDDREIASMLHGVLQSNGYRVFLAPNGAEGQRQISSLKPDLVITDMMMPRLGGFPVLEYLKTLDAPPPVIMITPVQKWSPPSPMAMSCWLFHQVSCLMMQRT